MSSKDFFDPFCQIAKDMKAISCLQRLWSPLPGSTSELAGAVSTDELDPWMLLEPRFQGCRLPIWEKIYWDAILQIDEESAVFFSTTQGKLINAKHLRRRHLW